MKQLHRDFLYRSQATRDPSIVKVRGMNAPVQTIESTVQLPDVKWIASQLLFEELENACVIHLISSVCGIDVLGEQNWPCR